jgi:hypothetical protein
VLQAVLSQLGQLKKKLTAAAAAERVPAPSEDPYDRCDPGSGGQAAAAAQNNNGAGEGSDGECGGQESLPNAVSAARTIGCGLVFCLVLTFPCAVCSAKRMAGMELSLAMGSWIAWWVACPTASYKQGPRSCHVAGMRITSVDHRPAALEKASLFWASLLQLPLLPHDAGP